MRSSNRLRSGAAIGAAVLTMALVPVPSVSAAPSDLTTCTPTARLSAAGTAKTATGSADCYMPARTEIGVTTIFYVNGYNEDSTYRTCVTDEQVFECMGDPITKVTSGAVCARVIVDWTDPVYGDFVQKKASTGSQCPL